MTTKCFLAEEHVVVYHHFESAAAGWQQLQTPDGQRKLLQQFVCQTDSARSVVSLHAIFDAYIVLLHNENFSFVGSMNSRLIRDRFYKPFACKGQNRWVRSENMHKTAHLQRLLR